MVVDEQQLEIFRLREQRDALLAAVDEAIPFLDNVGHEYAHAHKLRDALIEARKRVTG